MTQLTPEQVGSIQSARKMLESRAAKMEALSLDLVSVYSAVEQRTKELQPAIDALNRIRATATERGEA